MKKLFTFAMMLLFAATVFAQNNDRISYQAVVRTSDNVLVYDQDLTVTIAIANSESGSAVYGEQHNVHSNANGLISLMIGTGTNKTGNWNNIEWNHAWVTATIKKGAETLATHHVPMSAVPYALYAEKVNCEAVNACVGNGKLTFTDGATNTKEYTANQTTDLTVNLGKAAFTNNYNDLTNKPAIPAAANDGVLTITDGTDNNTKTFTADQATNTTVTLGKAAFTNNYSDLTGTPTISNNTITIKDAAGNTVGSFTLNQATDGTVTLPAINNGKLTITDGTNDNKKEFTANQATEQTVTLGKAAFTNNYNDLTNQPAIPAAANNNTITIKDAAGNTVGSFTLDQATDGTITLPAQVVPMQKSVKFTATAGQTAFALNTSGKTLDANNYLVQMYINGVYVGDSVDGVVTVSGNNATYVPANNGSYALMAGDRVQIVYWVK